MRSYTSKHFLF